MTRGLTLIVAALVALAPFAASAQTTTDQKAGTAAGAAAAPAAPATKPAEKKPAVTFTPYGFVQVTADFDNGNFAADAQYPGQVATAQSATNTRAFLIHARNSRFGVRIGLPEALGAKLGATFEVDFRGGFCSATGCPSSSISSYQPLLRLRLAYGTATWSLGNAYNVTLLAGQDYGLVTPLFATSAAYTGDPIFWKAGNTWHRAPQIRLSGESTGPFGFLWQAALVSPQDIGNGADLETPFVAPGNRSRRPDLEGRVALNMKSGKTKVIEVGVAGHLGWERYGTATTGTAVAVEPTKDLRSEMVGVDAQINTKFLGLKGEAWQGSNIEDYFTALGSGVTGVGTTGVRSLRNRGMWGQAVLQPMGTTALQLTFGAGIEQPKAADLTFGTALSLAGNRMLSGGIILNPSANWRAGVELTKTLTRYRSATAEREFQGYQTAVTTAFVF